MDEKASLMLKDNQVKWVDMMKMITKANPDIETTVRPKTGWRKKVHSFITGEGRDTNYFDIFINACIILNMIQMAFYHDDSSLAYTKVLDIINYFFTGIFAIECVLKLISFGTAYFKTAMNIFDFFVICASLFEIILNSLGTLNLPFLRIGPQIARVMRVLRVSRLIRLINRFKGLQALIQTLQLSMP